MSHRARFEAEGFAELVTGGIGFETVLGFSAQRPAIPNAGEPTCQSLLLQVFPG